MPTTAGPRQPAKKRRALGHGWVVFSKDAAEHRARVEDTEPGPLLRSRRPLTLSPTTRTLCLRQPSDLPPKPNASQEGRENRLEKKET